MAPGPLLSQARIAGGRGGVAGGLAYAAADGAGGRLDGHDAVDHYGAGQQAGRDVRVQVTGAALREAITDGWLACAPPRLARDFLAG